MLVDVSMELCLIDLAVAEVCASYYQIQIIQELNVGVVDICHCKYFSYIYIIEG